MNKFKLMKRNFKFFVPLMFKTQPLIIFFMIFQALLESLQSLLWVIIPNEIIRELTSEKDVKRIMYLVLILSISIFIISVLSRFISSYNNYCSRKVDFAIDKMTNDKIMKIDYFRIEEPEFKDLVSRAKKGMNEYSNGIYSMIWSIQYFIQDVITISGVIGIVLLSRQYFVVLISIVGIVINYLVNTYDKKANKNFNDMFTRYWRKINYYNRGIFNFQSQKELRAYSAKNMILDTCEKENKVAFLEYKKHAKKIGMIWCGEGIFYIFVTRMLSIILLTLACYNGKIELATVTMLFSAIQTLDGGFYGLIDSIKQYSQDCEYQDEFINLMEFKNVFRKGTLKLDKIETIEFKDVCFKYPSQENYVLKNINFKINHEEKVSLVGLNGSGKTTLIKLICRFYPLNSGSILINGRDIEEYDYDDYIKKIAVVFQDFYIISFSIKSNIANCDEDKEKLYDCLRRAQALELVEGLEKKEYTYVNKWFDKSGIEFSGGERQKFAIARALYKDGDFVILDEPTSALDPMAEAEIYYHFNDVVGRKTTLFISHRLSSCIFSDRILVLDGCEIVEEGSHKELMAKENSLYSKMFNAQAEYYK